MPNGCLFASWPLSLLAALKECAVERFELQAQLSAWVPPTGGCGSRARAASPPARLRLPPLRWLAGWWLGCAVESAPRCGCSDPCSARRSSGATPRSRENVPQDGRGTPQRGRASRRTGGRAVTGRAPAGREGFPSWSARRRAAHRMGELAAPQPTLCHPMCVLWLWPFLQAALLDWGPGAFAQEPSPAAGLTSLPNAPARAACRRFSYEPFYDRRGCRFSSPAKPLV